MQSKQPASVSVSCAMLHKSTVIRVYVRMLDLNKLTYTFSLKSICIGMFNFDK